MPRSPAPRVMHRITQPARRVTRFMTQLRLKGSLKPARIYFRRPRREKSLRPARKKSLSLPAAHRMYMLCGREVSWYADGYRRPHLCRQRGQNPLEDAQLSVSDFTEKSDEAIRLYEAIADLPEEDRRLLLLATVGGFSGREIARIMGRPEGTLRSRLSRCIKKLRCVLSDDHTFVGKEDTTHENVSPR